MTGGSPLLTRSFLAVLAATLAAFGGYALLLPVLPVWVASGGAGPALAGSVTGVFMAATVITQLGVPALLRAVGHRAALIVAAVALGAPAALLVLTPSPWLAMPVSVIRGAGFGVLTVTGAALVSDLVPARVRGRATGIYGVALGAPQLVLLTGGVWAWARLGPATVLLAGAVLPLLAVPAMVLLPRRVVGDPAPAAGSGATTVGGPTTFGGAGRRTFLAAAVAPWLVMLVCAASAGGVITVLPLTQPAGPAAGALFALTAAQLVGRSVAGELGDRLGIAGRITAPALVVAALGAGTGRLGPDRGRDGGRPRGRGPGGSGVRRGAERHPRHPVRPRRPRTLRPRQQRVEHRVRRGNRPRRDRAVGGARRGGRPLVVRRGRARLRPRPRQRSVVEPSPD